VYEAIKVAETRAELAQGAVQRLQKENDMLRSQLLVAALDKPEPIPSVDKFTVYA